MVVFFQGSSQSGVIVVIDAVAWEYETQMRHAKELAVSSAVCEIFWRKLSQGIDSDFSTSGKTLI